MQGWVLLARPLLQSRTIDAECEGNDQNDALLSLSNLARDQQHTIQQDEKDSSHWRDSRFKHISLAKLSRLGLRDPTSLSFMSIMDCPVAACTT